MNMEKKLKSSLRENKRYLLLETESDVEKVILDFIGILGYAKVSPKSIRKGKARNIGATREVVDNVGPAFALAPQPIKVKKISGTIKGLRIRE